MGDRRVAQRDRCKIEHSGPAEAKAWAEDQRELDERGEFFFSCTQFCFTAKRPG